MDYQSYRSHPAISKSDLDLINESGVANLVYSRRVKKESSSNSLDIGRCLHTIILEPELFESEFIVEPKVDKRTIAGKAKYAEFRDSIKGLDNVTLIEKSDHDNLVKMKEDLFCHPKSILLKGNIEVEKSLFFQVDDIECKSRLDLINHDYKLLIDIKTTADMSRLWRSFKDYRYHVQDAFYTEAARQNGLEGYSFIFAVISTSQTHGYHKVDFIELTEDKKEKGISDYLKNLEEYKNYNENEIEFNQLDWTIYE